MLDLNLPYFSVSGLLTITPMDVLTRKILELDVKVYYKALFSLEGAGLTLFAQLILSSVSLADSCKQVSIRQIPIYLNEQS